MDYGVMLPGGSHTIDEGIQIARMAEQRGFASAYCVEAYRGALVPLAAVAMGTERIRIGPYILNAWGRSPWLTTLAAIDLDELSGGRLVLCVGPGNKHLNEESQGLEFQRPAPRMEEFIGLVRQMSRRRPGDPPLSFEGEFLSLHNWSPQVEPVRGAVPVYGAAIGPAMRRVVGRVADGVALGTLLSPEYLAGSIRPDVLGAARQVGRDPAEIGWIMAYFVSCDDDRAKARAAARRAIAGLYAPLPHPYYDFLLREQGFSAVADDLAELVPDGRHDAAHEAITDDLLDALTASGTPEECRSALARFEGMVDEVVMVNVRGPVDPSGSDDLSPEVSSYSKMLDILG